MGSVLPTHSGALAICTHSIVHHLQDSLPAAADTFSPVLPPCLENLIKWPVFGLAESSFKPSSSQSRKALYWNPPLTDLHATNGLVPQRLQRLPLLLTPGRCRPEAQPYSAAGCVQSHRLFTAIVCVLGSPGVTNTGQLSTICPLRAQPDGEHLTSSFLTRRSVALCGSTYRLPFTTRTRLAREVPVQSCAASCKYSGAHHCLRLLLTMTCMMPRSE